MSKVRRNVSIILCIELSERPRVVILACSWQFIVITHPCLDWSAKLGHCIAFCLTNGQPSSLLEFFLHRTAIARNYAFFLKHHISQSRQDVLKNRCLCTEIIHLSRFSTPTNPFPRTFSFANISMQPRTCCGKPPDQPASSEHHHSKPACSPIKLAPPSTRPYPRRPLCSS